MSVKTEVLKLLEASRDRDLSGQEMAFSSVPALYSAPHQE